jgi:hypothetical protein
MDAANRLIDSLAERLYRAHQEWRRDLSEANDLWPLWFALDGQYKMPYRDAARAFIAGEERG